MRWNVQSKRVHISSVGVVLSRLERGFPFTRFECSFPFTRFECSFPFTRFECSFHLTHFECSFPFTRFECSFRLPRAPARAVSLAGADYSGSVFHRPRRDVGEAGTDE